MVKLARADVLVQLFVTFSVLITPYHIYQLKRFIKYNRLVL